MSENCLVQIMAPNEEWFRVLPNANQLATDVIQRAVRESGKVHSSSEVSVVFSDDRELQLLNKEYRSIDKPTNVLSFPGPELPDEDPNAYTAGGRPQVLGDIVLALETTEREAQEQGKELKHHVAHLLVHGTLHLLRFDHENDRDAELMENLERKVLAALGIGDPYVVPGEDDEDEPALAPAVAAAPTESDASPGRRRKKSAARVRRVVTKAPSRRAPKAAAPKQRAKAPAAKAASPKRRTPAKAAAPKRAAAKRSAPKRKPAKAAAPKRAVKRVVAKRAAPKRAAPKRTAAKRAAPRRVARNRAAPKRVSAKRATPKRAIARRAAPRKTAGKSRSKKR